MEIATEAMSGAVMVPESGPEGAEKFIVDYENAHLLEIRAGLVENTVVMLAAMVIHHTRRHGAGDWR